MSTSVMDEIKKLEDAKNDYQRTQLRNDLCTAFSGGRVSRWGSSDSAGGVFLDGPESAIKHIKPRIEQLLPQNTATLQIRYDSLSGDLDIADEEMPGAMADVARKMKTDVLTAAEDVRFAYETTLQNLESKANPWHPDDEKQGSALTRYMLELQLIGGPGRHKQEVIDNATAALESGDPGGIEFWHRNFGRIYPNTPDTAAGGFGDNGPSFQSSLEVVQGLDAARLKAMNTEQREAYESAKKLRDAWMMSDMDELLDVAVSGPTADKMFGVVPRERDEREKQVARRRADFRKARAKLNEVE